ncbi:MAG TPA: hypothetical protein VD962_12200 [Rubricoccaceae bacterium]|nr:hypothetical protein [Rubricoccaceae bacterium]
MGIDRNAARYLAYVRRRGVDFARTATLGRQGLHLSARQLHGAAQRQRLALDDTTLASIFLEAGGYAEPFLRLLGAHEVDSFDVSAYEGATHLHDFNAPLPDEYKNRYTVVFDGGSLEHVFNVPVALRSAMEMVTVGGHFLAYTPANNLFGHGFYQFSPELFFRVFTPENGYAVEEVVLCVDSRLARWRAVADPAEVRSRVTLVNRAPTYLFVRARRVAAVAPLARPPQQDDYAAAWDRGQGESPEVGAASRRYGGGPLGALHEQLLAPVGRRLRRWLTPRYRPDHFRPLDDAR